MSQPEARAWWADVEDLRERIESRRAGTRPPLRPGPGSPAREHPAGRRTVTITGRPATGAAPRAVAGRERPPRVLAAATRSPDRIAGWAALLGLVLVLVSTASN